MFDFEQLRILTAKGFVEVFFSLPESDRPTMEIALNDAFQSGFKVLEKPYIDTKLNLEMLLDFIKRKDLIGEYSEYLNESHLDNWKGLKEHIMNLKIDKE